MPLLRKALGASFRAVRAVCDFAVLFAVALYVEATIRRANIARLAARLGVPVATRSADEAPAPAVLQPLPRWARRRLRTAHRVMALWPFAADRKCLRESLVVGFALRRLGPSLQIGVQSGKDRLVAHAWVECRGHVLDPTAQQYAALTGSPSA